MPTFVRGNTTEVKVVYNRIGAYGAYVSVSTAKLLHTSVQEMEADAKSRLQPGYFGYDTGKARDSIHGLVTSQRTAELVGGGPEAPWFAYNEFGTIHREAAPALMPAWEDGSHKFLLKLAQIMKGPFGVGVVVGDL